MQLSACCPERCPTVAGTSAGLAYQRSRLAAQLTGKHFLQVLAQHRLSGTAMMTVRRPGDCNFFTDPGCDISRPNKQFSETQLQARRPAENPHCRRCLSLYDCLMAGCG
jgi:hypothetical protein